MHSRLSHTLGVTISWLFASLLVASPGSAQTTPEQKAAAEALFLEGRQYMEAGSFSQACAKFEQSEKLDSATGTLLNLADCYEKLGRLASAWVTFKSAASAARRSGQAPREQLARDRAAGLESRLAKLTINVASGDLVDGPTVVRGGATVDKLLWGQPVPVDAGTVTIEATAPGKLPWKQTVEVVDGHVVTVDVPALEGDPAAPTAPLVTGPVSEAPPLQRDSRQDTTKQRDWVLPVIVGGTGVVLMGGGGFFALRAASKNSDSKDHCSGSVCDQKGVDLRDQAVMSGNIATALFAVGTAAVVGGVVLYFVSSPSGEATAERHEIWATAAAGPGGGGVNFHGTW